MMQMSLDPTRELERIQLTKMLGKLVFRTICDIVNYRDSQNPDLRKIHDAAYRWMYVEDGYDPELVEDDEDLEKALRDFDQLMSFESICGTLGWDPDWVRNETKALTKAALRKAIKNNGLT